MLRVAIAANILAGSSPSPRVAWLAGRGGAVVRTIDGSQWERVVFPETVDLLADPRNQRPRGRGDAARRPHFPDHRRRPDLVAARTLRLPVLRTEGNDPPSRTRGASYACAIVVCGRLDCRGCGFIRVLHDAGQADRARSKPPTAHQTTIDDQTDLSVTVYNSDLALVRDTRNVSLQSGSFDLQFMDIAATVNPATIHFRSLTSPGAVSVLEQNYEYRPPRARQAASQVRRQGRHAHPDGAKGRQHRARGSASPASQLQQRAGLANRLGDRHRAARRSHPLSRAPGESLQPSNL